MSDYGNKRKRPFFVFIAVLAIGAIIAGCYFGSKLGNTSAPQDNVTEEPKADETDSEEESEAEDSTSEEEPSGSDDKLPDSGASSNDETTDDGYNMIAKKEYEGLYSEELKSLGIDAECEDGDRYFEYDSKEECNFTLPETVVVQEMVFALDYSKDKDVKPAADATIYGEVGSALNIIREEESMGITFNRYMIVEKLATEENGNYYISFYAEADSEIAKNGFRVGDLGGDCSITDVVSMFGTPSKVRGLAETGNIISLLYDKDEYTNMEISFMRNNLDPKGYVIFSVRITKPTPDYVPSETALQIMEVIEGIENGDILAPEDTNK